MPEVQSDECAKEEDQDNGFDVSSPAGASALIATSGVDDVQKGRARATYRRLAPITKETGVRPTDARPRAICLDDALSAAHNRLFDWLRACGGEVGEMAVGTVEELRGLHAAGCLSVGDTLLHVPTALLVDVDVAAATAVGQCLIAADSGLSERALLAAFLLTARRDGGFWKPWVDTMPHDFSAHPLFYGAAELSALDEWSEARYTVQAVREECRQAHERILACAVDGAQWSGSDFAWAYACVLSRAFRRDGRAGSRFVMVPVADLFNHEQHGPVQASLHEGGFRVSVEEPITAEQPIALCYGQSPNSLLLATHGFCLQGNPWDTASLPVGNVCLSLSACPDEDALADILVNFDSRSGKRAALVAFRDACLIRAEVLRRRSASAPPTVGGRQIASIMTDEVRILERHAAWVDPQLDSGLCR